MNNQLVATSQPTMSSLEFAELTGKRHDNVLRDIDSMLEELGVLKSKVTSFYWDKQSKKRPQFELNEELSLTLVSGYNIKMRHAIIKRWQELEAKNQQPAPPNFSDRIAMVQLYIENEQ